MKKHLLFTILFLLVSAFVFSSCAKPPSYQGQFVQDEFVLSMGEHFNPYEKLSLSGTDKSNVTISLSNEIASWEDDELVMGSTPGKAIIYAQKDNKTFASAIIAVKAKFNSISFVSIDENGLVSWNSPHVFYFGQDYTPKAYSVQVEEKQATIVTSCQYQMKSDEKGEHNIKITPLNYSQQDKSDELIYVDSGSEKSFAINYGSMQAPSGFVVEENSDISSGKITHNIRWDSQANAVYDVYNGDFCIAQDLRTSEYNNFDFTNLAEGRSVDISIVAKDSRRVDENLKNSPKKATFTVNKLSLHSAEEGQDKPQYITEGSEGYIRWKDDAASHKYKISYSSITSPHTSGTIDISGENSETRSGYVYTRLDMLDYGVYDIKVQAKAQEGLYADSDVVTIQNVAKLDKPNIDFNFDNVGQNLKITFPTDEINSYVVNFSLSINGENSTHSQASGQEYSKALSSLDKGEISVKMRALPTFIDENVKEISINDVRSTKVLSSSENIQTLYKLADFPSITHSYDKASDQSTLTFNAVENVENDASCYSLAINGQPIEATPTIEGEEIKFTIKNLSTHELNEQNAYNFTVSATRTDGKSNTLTQEKVVQVLSKPTKATEQENGYFAWNSLEGEQGNNAKYAYKIYNSDKAKTDNHTSVEQIAQSGEVDLVKGQKTYKINSQLSFGYYHIEVKALSTDNYDNFLDSDFGNLESKVEENYLWEFFLVYQKIEQPKLDFYEEEGVYKLKVYAEEHAAAYDVTLSDLVDGRESATQSFTIGMTDDQFKIHNFEKNAFPDSNNKTKSYTIKVQARVDTNTGDSDLFPNSDYSKLTLIRLGKPTYTVDNDENLSVDIPQGAKYVLMTIDGAEVNKRQFEEQYDSTYSLKKISGISDITFKYISASEDIDKVTEATIYLDSLELKQNFKRITQPKNLKFENGKLTFESEDKEYVDYYIFRLTLAFDEGQTDKEYDIHLTKEDVESANYSIDINSEIVKLETSSEYFSEDYEQCKSVTISILAYRLGQIGGEGTFYMPSVFSNKLEVKKLDAPNVTFNTTLSRVEWNSVGNEQTRYNVIFNGIVTSNNQTGQYYEADPDKFMQQVEVYLIAVNPQYLTSATSNRIYVRRLAPISSLQISPDGKATAAIDSQDRDKVASITLDGTEIEKKGLKNSTFDKASGMLNLDISEFSKNGSYKFAIIVKANDSADNTNFYISSAERVFSFYNLAETEIIGTKDTEQNIISWTNLAEKFVGQEGEPLTYSVSVYIQEDEQARLTISGLTDNFISLAQEDLVSLVEGRGYTIKVKAVIANEYNITSSLKSQAVGYYGSGDVTLSHDDSSVFKIAEIPENYTAQIADEDDELYRVVEDRMRKDLEIRWDDIWSDQLGTQKDLLFDIPITTGNPQLDDLIGKYLTGMKDGLNQHGVVFTEEGMPNYRFGLKRQEKQNPEGQKYRYEYVFYFNSYLARKLFSNPITPLPIQVYRKGDIRSETRILLIRRINSVESASVSPEGVLNFSTVSGANRYLVRILTSRKGTMLLINSDGSSHYNGVQVEEDHISVNLLDAHVDNFSGAYSVNILADYKATGENDRTLTALEALEITGYRLVGIESHVIEDDGNVRMKIADADSGYEPKFAAYYNGHRYPFEPRVEGNIEEDEELTYNYSIAEFLELFAQDSALEMGKALEFEVALQQEEHIDSLRHKISFIYDSAEADTLEARREKTIVYSTENLPVVTENKASDYFILTTKDGETTTGIWVNFYSVTMGEEGEVRGEKQECSFTLEDLLGYWVVYTDGREEFLTLQPAQLEDGSYGEEIKSVTSCYGFSINNVLKWQEKGDYVFTISRIAKRGSDVILYAGNDVRVSKLQSIAGANNITLNENTLSWSNAGDIEAQSFYVTVYRRTLDIVQNKNTYKLEKRKEIFGAPSADLSSLIVDNIDDYCLTITPVSSNEGKIIVAGDPCPYIIITKYSSPTKIVVNDGKIRFAAPQTLEISQGGNHEQTYWEEEYPFLRIIRENDTNNSYIVSNLMSATFKKPFNFSPNQFISTYEEPHISLMFTAGHENYYARNIRAVDLLPPEIMNITYLSGAVPVNYMERLQTAIQSVTSSTIRDNAQRFYNAIAGSAFGVASEKLLFDEYGESVPAGTYAISIRQEGRSLSTLVTSGARPDDPAREGHLPSEYMHYIDDSYLIEAPVITLSSDVNPVTAKNRYYIDFTIVNKHSKRPEGGIDENALVTEYRLNFKLPGDSTIKEFKIVYVEGKYYLKDVGQEDAGVELEIVDDSKIRINLTEKFITYEKAQDLIDGIERTLSIYAVGGDDYCINSKTNPVTTAFLTFNYNSITLQNGQLRWTNDSEMGTVVTYQTQYGGAKQMTIEKGQPPLLTLESVGNYKYVSFMAKGGIFGRARVHVDSQSYGIQNLYKLSPPTIKTFDNQIQITSLDNASASLGANLADAYNMSNDISVQSEKWIKLDAHNMQASGNSWLYLPGNYKSYNEGDDHDVRRDEAQANTFYVTQGGSTAANSSSEGIFNVDKASEENQNFYDYVLTLKDKLIGQGEQIIILESNRASLNAKMLPTAKIEAPGIRIENGDFIWNNFASASDIFGDEQGTTLQEGYKLGYRVDIDYFDSTPQKLPTPKQTLYVLQEEGQTTTLAGNFISLEKTYNNFKITLRALAFKVVEESALGNGIYQSVYKEYISAADSPTFAPTADQPVYVLGGEEYLYDVLLHKFVPEVSGGQPILSSIDGNKIKVTYQNDFVRGETHFKLINLATGRLVDGQSWNYVNDDYAECSLPTLTYNNGQPYQFAVYMYDNRNILSEEYRVGTRDIYKLAPVETDNLTLEFDATGQFYTMDFSEYFDNFKILNDASNMKIDVYSTQDISSPLTSVIFENQSLKIIDQASGTRPLPGEPAVTISSDTTFFFVASSAKLDNVLSSEESERITITYSAFGGLDKVTWDAEENCLTWTNNSYSIAEGGVDRYVYNDEEGTMTLNGKAQEGNIILDGEIEVEGQKYYRIDGSSRYVKAEDVQFNPIFMGKEYRVVIHYQGLGTGDEVAYVTPQSEQDLKYYPRKMGQITSVDIYVRNGGLSIFSDKPITLQGPILLDMFASGDGISEESAYVISNVEQFKNMILRNSSTEKYYFKLADKLSGLDENGEAREDLDYLTLEIKAGESADQKNESHIISGPFYGNFDGNGKTIKLKITGYDELSSPVNQSLADGTSTTPYSFRFGSSIFESIAQGGSVANFNLDVDIEIVNIALGQGMDNVGVLFAPIALTNNGTISNIDVNTYSTKLSLGADAYIVIAGVGIAGVNRGSIIDCTNKATIQMPVSSPRASYIPYVLYSGIALQTLATSGRAVIQNCFSTGDITVYAKRSNSKLWVSGIVTNISSGGYVENCGNDSNINLDGNNNIAHAYVGGITVRSQNGRINYSYNNGKTTVDGEATTDSKISAGGIAYQLQSTTVNTIVDTSGGKAVASSVGNNGTCYENSSSGGGLSSQTLQTLNENTSQSGKRLVVESASDGWKAKII